MSMTSLEWGLPPSNEPVGVIRLTGRASEIGMFAVGHGQRIRESVIRIVKAVVAVAVVVHSGHAGFLPRRSCRPRRAFPPWSARTLVHEDFKMETRTGETVVESRHSPVAAGDALPGRQHVQAYGPRPVSSLSLAIRHWVLRRLFAAVRSNTRAACGSFALVRKFFGRPSVSW